MKEQLVNAIADMNEEEALKLAGLQQPPELIHEIIDRWQDGAKVVHEVKRQRTTSHRLRRWLTWIQLTSLVICNL